MGQAFHPRLAAGEGGAIVNIVGNIWQRGAATMAHAGAARAGVVNLTRPGSQSMGPPRAGERRLSRDHRHSGAAALRRGPGRVVEARAAATARVVGGDRRGGAVPALPASAYITGADLVVDGGFQNSFRRSPLHDRVSVNAAAAPHQLLGNLVVDSSGLGSRRPAAQRTT